MVHNESKINLRGAHKVAPLLSKELIAEIADLVSVRGFIKIRLFAVVIIDAIAADDYGLAREHH